MTTLSSLCDLIVDCEHKTAPTTEMGYPLIRTPDVGVGRIHLERALRVDESTYRAWTRRAVPQAGDLILAREAPVGNIGIVQPGVHPVLGQRTVLIRPRSEVLDPYYLNYLMSGPELRGWMEGVSTGATVPHLNMADIRAMELPALPPISTQRKIGAILAAYDDLIECTSSRIMLLEEMAQRIYREWFVDFRYPGHENVPLVQSELGPMPSGWTWLTAAEALTINPKIAVNGTTIRPFVPMTSVSEHGMHIAPLEDRVGASGARFVNGDTLFARITPCLENGKTAYVQCLPHGAVASGSTEFIVLRSQRLTPELTYLLARDKRFRSHAIQSMSGATGRQRVREECFATFWLATPPQTLLDSFGGVIRPMFTLSDLLFRAVSGIREARDLLLPRLVSGEIDVGELDIAMPQAAA